MKKTVPKISVIIPAYNEEKYIKYPIGGLKDQSFKNFEAIVVDGGSTDRTRKIIGKNAKVIVELRRGIALGRNIGAAKSKGKILVFLDADTKPSRRLLQSYYNAFSDKGVIAATGPIYPLEKTSWAVNTGYKFVSIGFVKFSIKAGMPSVVGSNFAVRADVFRKVHGFNVHLSTYEDWDLSNKLKKYGKIVFVDGASVRTSTRRVEAWGIWGYFLYHVSNMFMYNVLKTTRKNYGTVR